MALTVAAEATTDLKVGSLVFGNDYRHPVVLAKEIATLDLLSEGRVEFGLGAGWMTTDYEQSGIAHDPPGVRISRMSEIAGRHEVAVVDRHRHVRGRPLHGDRGRRVPRPRPAGPIRRSSSVEAGGGCSASPPGRPTSSG